MKNNFPIGFRKALEEQIDKIKHRNLTLDYAKDKGDVFPDFDTKTGLIF